MASLMTGPMTGSSPRVRGTLRKHLPDMIEGGIIPACAGNTHVCLPLREPFGDHPRVCGEHTAIPSAL